jgi:soluble lytic murein transglycosylase
MSLLRSPALRRAVAALILAAAANTGFAEDPVLTAQDAYRAGNRARLAQQLDAARGHELEAYVEYWDLLLRIDEVPPSEVASFLQRHQGSVLADRLRADWLKQLGKTEDWIAVEREYPALVQGDQETLCLGLRARLARHEPAALAEARSLWTEVNLPPVCGPVLEQLYNSGRIGVEDVWQRLRRLIEVRRLAAARVTAGFLPEGQAPDGKTLERLIEAPAAFLHKLKPGFAATRSGRETAMMAVVRMARSDPAVATRSFGEIRDRLQPAERAYVWLQLGHQGALNHLPEALSWYRLAGDAPMSEEQIAWKARAALRAQDWPLVLETVEAMPPQLATQPDWTYWRARALAAADRRGDAELLYRSIAHYPNFYGNLATEELGRSVALPARAVAANKAELETAAQHPAIRRALALFRLEMRTEAVREWNWALRGQDDRFLLAAAELARRNGIFDRAISSADRTQREHDYHLRFPAPFRELVEARARELDLDNCWVYGLMRQESRFVMDARSSAGARGLMQVMPATARWVARKVGMKEFSVGQINDMDTNVALGTHYLKLVLDSFDGHPVLASAAYNAGPGRARRWRDSKPIEGAIYAETIPFSETRDYVKKVMSNTLYYATLFEERPQSLKARLGTIAPAGAGPEAELP